MTQTCKKKKTTVEIQEQAMFVVEHEELQVEKNITVVDI